MIGMPMFTGPVRLLLRVRRSSDASFLRAASRLTWSPWTSPSQPLVRASAIRSARLRVISTTVHLSPLVGGLRGGEPSEHFRATIGDVG
jgi:hypothetical protein